MTKYSKTLDNTPSHYLRVSKSCSLMQNSLNINVIMESFTVKTAKWHSLVYAFTFIINSRQTGRAWKLNIATLELK